MQNRKYIFKIQKKKKIEIKKCNIFETQKIKCNNSPQILLLSPYHRRPAVQQINSALKISFENYCFPPVAVLEMWECAESEGKSGLPICKCDQNPKTSFFNFCSIFSSSIFIARTNHLFFYFSKNEVKNLLRAAANQSIWPQNILPRKRFNNLKIYIFGWVGVKQNKYSTDI